MENINIVYVDDSPDIYLNLFLKSYKTLLEKPAIRDANIVFIDSRLFENRGVGGVFSGEEFKLILKKTFPYIEVIVISQKAIGDGFQTIAKYDLSVNVSDVNDIRESAFDFYSHEIIPLIEKKIQNVIEYRKILERIQNEKIGIDKYLVENIENSIKGIDEYDQLSSKDLDKVIKAFQSFVSKIE